VLARIAALLVDTIGVFFVFLLLLRFHFQWLRVPFRNPVGEFVVALTNWIVRPARRVLPGLAGLDIATLAAAWLLQALVLWLMSLLLGLPAAGLSIAAGALVDLLRYSLYILGFCIFLQAILSWINPYTPIAPVLDAVARPFLRPLRRYVPPVANFDLTPAILLLIVLVALIPVNELRIAVGSL
jgi:YggT family protein